MIRSRHARRNVGIDQIVPAVVRDEAIARGEIDALAPFGLGHVRGHFLEASFRWRHPGSPFESLISRSRYRCKRVAARLSTCAGDMLHWRAMAQGAGIASKLEMLRPRMSYTRANTT